jgi:hypothetical protein
MIAALVMNAEPLKIFGSASFADLLDVSMYKHSKTTYKAQQIWKERGMNL